MAHLTIQIGASVVIPMPTRPRRRGARSICRAGSAHLRWRAIREAALLASLPDEAPGELGHGRCVCGDQAMRHALLGKKGKLS